MKILFISLVFLVNLLFANIDYAPCEIKGCKLKCTGQNSLDKINIVDISGIYVSSHEGGTVIYNIDMGMAGEKKIVVNSLNGICEVSGLR